MTAKTLPEALAIERARGDEYRAEIRAEGFRAGAEAMRESAANEAQRLADEHFGETQYLRGIRVGAQHIKGRIRSLSIPEDNGHDRCVPPSTSGGEG